MKIFLSVQGLPDKNVIVSLVVSSWYECMKLCSKKRESCSLLAYSEVIQERSNCYLYDKDLENSGLKRNLNLITYKGSKEENWQVYELMEITSVSLYTLFKYPVHLWLNPFGCMLLFQTF